MADACPDTAPVVVYSQYYRAATAARQQELHACLARNLNHAGIDKLVLFLEDDAPPLPAGSVPLEVIGSRQRLTYADWFRQVRLQGQGIALLLNADIELEQGLDHLAAVFDDPGVFLALSRYNPAPGGASLNRYPHWTQDVWGVRADAPLSDSLLHACGFPLGFPGCDNRIADVMWSHGFRLRNPCYLLRSLHRHAETGRAYDTTADRLYGGVCYVHPSLAAGEDSELEHAIWSRSAECPGGVLINRQAVGGGVQKLPHPEAAAARPFEAQQLFTGLCWQHSTLGGGQVEAPLPESRSEDTLFLPLGRLTGEGVELSLQPPAQLRGFSLRLPRRCRDGARLRLEVCSGAGDCVAIPETADLEIPGGGRRLFLEPASLGSIEVARLKLRLTPAATLEATGEGERQPAREVEMGAEMVLFPTNAAAGTAAATPGFTTLDRLAAAETLERAEPLQCFGSRFRVLGDGERLLFEDRFWPTVGSCTRSDLPGDPADPRTLLLVGFGQPCLERRPGAIHSRKRFSADGNFWQYPCRTEEDAQQVHRALSGPQLRDGCLHLYLGLPWATWLDRESQPTSLLRAHGSRIAALRRELARQQLELRVHSVCQHILWRDVLAAFREAGVDCLWLSHKPPGEDRLEGIELRPWHLYPVNAREPDRRDGLTIRPCGERPWLASFVGAHMKHYITDVRPRLQQLADHPGVLIELKEEWHFNSVVYGDQMQIPSLLNRPRSDDRDDCRHYNEVLSSSRFSLCPAGAGPNSLRLWESLSVGSVPVILSDHLELPDAAAISGGLLRRWEEVALLHPEAELDSLLPRLEAIPLAEIEHRSRLGIALMERVNRFTCFGGPVERELPPLPVEAAPPAAGLSAASPPPP